MARYGHRLDDVFSSEISVEYKQTNVSPAKWL